MPQINRNLNLLIQGQFVSDLGTQAFLIAAVFFTLETTGSGFLVATVMLASSVPAAVLAPLGGAVADRHSRRAILIVTDWSRAVAVGGLWVFIEWGAGDPTANVAAILAVAAFNGIMGAFFAPAVQSFIPDLVARERLTSANSFAQMSRQTATLLGQAIGGVLYVSWGLGGLMLFDTLSFAYGGLATGFVQADRPHSRVAASLSGFLRGYLAETRQGIAYVWRREGMRNLLVFFAGVNFLFVPVFVLLPLYVNEVLGQGPELYGFLLAGSGAGAVAGSLAASALQARTGSRVRLVRACVGALALALMLLAAARVPWMALVAFAVIGGASSVVNVIVVTAFQSGAPFDLRGRVMAVVVALSSAAIPLGMAAGGVIGDVWRDSLGAVLALSSAAVALLVAATWRLPGIGQVLDGDSAAGE